MCHDNPGPQMLSLDRFAKGVQPLADGLFFWYQRPYGAVRRYLAIPILDQLFVIRCSGGAASCAI